MSKAEHSRSLLQQIGDERKKASQIRTGVTIGVLLMFGIFGAVTYNRVNSFDDEALLLHLQSEASTTVWPVVVRELDAVAKDAGPAINEAMQNEMETLLPRLVERLTQEAATFQSNMNERIKVSLDGAIAAELSTRESELQGALEGFDSESELYDDLVRRLMTSQQQWAMTQLDTIFDQHINVLQSINGSIGTLQAQVEQERAAGKRGDANIDEAMELFIEILNARISEEG